MGPVLKLLLLGHHLWSYLLILLTKQKVRFLTLSYASLGRHSVTILDTVRPSKSIQRKQASFIPDATIKRVSPTLQKVGQM